MTFSNLHVEQIVFCNFILKDVLAITFGSFPARTYPVEEAHETGPTEVKAEVPIMGASSPLGSLMLHRQDFIDMNQELHEYDEMREKIIKRSREILKSSKQAIFALHRSDTAEALRMLGDAEKVIPELNEYLGGVVDFTGELMRYAVVKATAREVDEVKRCKDMVEAISGELIQFDFRNGPLRRKFDSVKYNLRKLENTLYELSLVTNSGLKFQTHSMQETPATSTRDNGE
ncbi:hypothetical protein PInf_016441 [Phytophthora infestans]|nr:hypothetical protein PInf_016441 [Phytophthora infestans]